MLKAREPWQGILGPTIRGEVGDMAIVHFFNNASMLLSMHPHGSRYIKVHEGEFILLNIRRFYDFRRKSFKQKNVRSQKKNNNNT